MIGDHKFALGQLLMTRGVEASVPRDEVLAAVARHVSGDRGDMPPEDCELNDAAVRDGGRIMSAYVASDGTRFWVITEWDRSCTTVLLPEEY